MEALQKLAMLPPAHQTVDYWESGQDESKSLLQNLTESSLGYRRRLPNFASRRVYHGSAEPRQFKPERVLQRALIPILEMLSFPRTTA